MPGDGSSLWTITHNSDFAMGLVGLLGHAQAIGHAFHITSDEVLTWNQILSPLPPRPLALNRGSSTSPPISSPPASPTTRHPARRQVALLRLRQLQNQALRPRFRRDRAFREGIARTLAWFDADPARQEIDDEADAAWDRLIAAYERGLEAAQHKFGR